MPRTKQVLEDKPEKVILAEEALKQAREEARKEHSIAKARATMKEIVELFHQEKDSATDVDSIYEVCKNIFFRVNGARRVLKNA